MPHPSSIFVHVVTFNHQATISSCLKSLMKQEGFTLSENLTVLVSDNASTDGSFEKAQTLMCSGVEVKKNPVNLGFCAAHNQGLSTFLKSGKSYYLCLNPDLALKEDALLQLSRNIESGASIGAACPKLIRADENLNPKDPIHLDAAGMYFTPTLRHFDRGSGELDREVYNERALVFGASGACVLFKKNFIQDLELSAGEREGDVDTIYPQLKAGRAERVLFFDEAFFAYREDADLSWRAQLFGWSTLFVPTAIGYHVRRVTSDVRGTLPAELNLLGVRNRFLMQLNQYSFGVGVLSFILGFILRNTLVVLGVFLKERTSLRAFADLAKLLRRGLVRRKIIAKRTKVPNKVLKKWFNTQPYSEKFNG